MSTKIETLAERVTIASEISKIPEDVITEGLANLGTIGDMAIAILEADTTSEQDILGFIHEASEKKSGEKTPLALLKAAVRVIKTGVNPLLKPAPGYVESPTISEMEKQAANTNSAGIAEAISGALNANKPIDQYSDKELIEKYAASGDGDLEPELTKRSKGNRFIVVPYEDSVKNTINVTATINMLKKARRGENAPQEYVDGDNQLHRIYTVMEFSPENRVVEISPLNDNTVLFDGYCEASGLNFTGVKDECRAFIRLIRDYLKEKNEVVSTSESRTLLELARGSGIAGLRNRYPQVAAEFDKLDLTNELPRLKRLKQPLDRDHAKKTVSHYFSKNKAQY